MDERNLEVMARRIERLERANRRWRWAGAGAAACVAALLWAGAPGAGTAAVAAARQGGEPATRGNLWRVERQYINLDNVCYFEDIKRNDPDPQVAGKLLIVFNGSTTWHYRYYDGDEAEALRRRLKEQAEDLSAD